MECIEQLFGLMLWTAPPPARERRGVALLGPPGLSAFELLLRDKRFERSAHGKRLGGLFSVGGVVARKRANYVVLKEFEQRILLIHEALLALGNGL